MTWFSALALAGAMLLLAITPGPGVFITVARALASGFGHAASVVAGIVLGDLIFLLLAIYGLQAAATALGDFFTLVKYAGGAYLIWLGIKIWRQPSGAHCIEGKVEHAFGAHFSAGLLITLSNPKVILFYLGFLPTFIALDRLSNTDVAIVAGIVSTVLGTVMLGYAYAAGRARRLVRSPEFERKLNRAAGAVMVTTGSVLIARS